VTGVDYRGVKVLAFLRPIPDSPWLMVAKVDRAEIYSPLQELAGMTAAVTAMFILAAALASIAWMRAQHDNEEKLRQANTELEQRVKSRTAELERSHQELQALIAVQESFQEEERKRFARELHDELAQKLTVLKLQIAAIMAAASAKDPGLTQQIQDVNSLLTETIHAVGQIAANLRPVVLDELGLVAALRDLAEEFSDRTKVECELSVHPADLSVDGGLATALYRMVQESLTNVARHAQATEVMVSLYRDASGTITLDINDNGKGFASVDQSLRRSFGLIGMRERAAMLGGEMKIHSQPGAGTSIEIVIPRSTDQSSGRAAVN
jgi:signal transduction histidine kinase